jgi:Cu2+-containing amine oxidase
MTANNAAARGHELVLWGAINAANYKYIERFTFRDDGVIIGDEGATGQNLPGAELIPHVHNALWRIDMDLYTPANNNASHMQHIEPSGSPTVATDTMTPIVTASGVQWNARTHDMIMIANTANQNARGHNPSYVLMPYEMGGGLAQHVEPFTRNDFWVTRYNPTQMAASQLPTYLGTPVANTDIVVWYKGSLHHHPRDEDGNYTNNGNGPWHGTALTMFAGFMLMPNALFDCTPFYNPGACP